MFTLLKPEIYSSEYRNTVQITHSAKLSVWHIKCSLLYIATK